MTTPFTSTMAPLTVTQAWFSVTFSADPATNDSYAPKITPRGPVVGGVPEFIMDVYGGGAACSLTPITSPACTDNGSNGSLQVTGWGTAWSGARPPTTNGIPTPGSGGQVWIKVYRNPAMPSNEYSCGTYTIQAFD